MHNPTIWYMQLHPGDPDAMSAKQIHKLLEKHGVIGLGSGWDDKNGNPVKTPEIFRSTMQIGDVVAIYSSNPADRCFVALVRVIGECRESEIEDEMCWFDIVRRVEILDEKPAYWKKRFMEETGKDPNKGLFFSTTLKRTSCDFLNFWYNSIERTQFMKMYVDCIHCLKNLILTGAPGTGKTFLARQIARSLVLDEEEKGLPEAEIGRLLAERISFVQFHPSYDYTDFVEGLRPVRSGEDGEHIGFERKDGTFKELCRRAVESAESGGVDNFEVAWEKLLEMLEDGERLSIPLISRRGEFPLALNEYGTGLASRTYDDSAKDWIRGQSKFFTKEQIYKVYRGESGVPSGGHDNYRKAIVEFMRKNCQLLPFKKGTSDSNAKQKSYVMVIDEINRGDIARIFGELFYAVDKGYRGKAGCVKTQYQNLIERGDPFFDGFYVPENVYIIGTMNDIDRGVESMDFAIRRRFTWWEVKPEDTQESILRSKFNDEDLFQKVKNRMDNLNAAIRADDGLGEAYCIGGAYFTYLDVADGVPDFADFWRLHLSPLLYEYLRGREESVKNQVVDTFKKAFENEQSLIQTNAEQS